jgi:hypothetical protein
MHVCGLRAGYPYIGGTTCNASHVRLAGQKCVLSPQSSDSCEFAQVAVCTSAMPDSNAA